MELRLIEQKCVFFMVRGRGGLKVRARLCLQHSREQCIPR